ncbi:hypothetical protein BN438_2879 [Erwinia amylovora UPN527]|uniref:Uncharacterized protein n=1 Tax=Erwinia amylovora NBRC 12687 = CFBP 1232 TaxID=1219359 RepID=A0A831EKT6_ERWAM|nr:hypothetical protein BN437_2904 [Erwinia amylovora NBRC 12687 = CFBP 1232]CCP00144.1 hypothetical protein BN438_2879 [Erwinia amylovora UPN527]
MGVFHGFFTIKKERSYIFFMLIIWLLNLFLSYLKFFYSIIFRTFILS